MTEKGKTVPQSSDDEWIPELTVVVDITYFKKLNVKPQGKNKLLSDMFSDVNAF
jgi:hypothetical protein